MIMWVPLFHIRVTPTSVSMKIQRPANLSLKAESLVVVIGAPLTNLMDESPTVKVIYLVQTVPLEPQASLEAETLKTFWYSA